MEIAVSTCPGNSHGSECERVWRSDYLPSIVCRCNCHSTVNKTKSFSNSEDDTRSKSNPKGLGRFAISEYDFQFLIGLGDTIRGYLARGEVAEMYEEPVEILDAMVLGQIYGKDWFAHRKY